MDDPVLAVERAYRLILGRGADTAGSSGYVRALRSGELSLPEVCARLAGSEEFAARLRPAEHAAGDVGGDGSGHGEVGPDWVDVAELIATTSVEELSERAEGYFRAVEDPEGLLAKPLATVGEAPDLLVTFGQVLRGLAPLPGMRVLDFGAGTCWTSRMLARLGCRVTALDVSATALDLGRRLFAREPVPDRSAPEFLVFDGHTLDLPDASMDRVLCFDALHHVPNPGEALREMARVLQPGGIAAFSEPGAHHSAEPRSQHEMRSYGIIENDIVIDDVWQQAQDAGFVDMRLCLLDSSPAWVDRHTFYDVVAAREQAGFFLESTRAAIADRRLFTLRREGVEVPDSRQADGLVGALTMDDLQVVASGATAVVTGTCQVHNPGPRTWLPSDAPYGGVRLGVRLHLSGTTMRELAPIALPDNGLGPGNSVTFPIRVTIPDLPEGNVAVEFGLVSDKVCWFSLNGSPVVKLPLRPSE